MYLLAIFVAQCLSKPGTRVGNRTRPLVRNGDDTDPGWTDLFAAPVYGPPPGKKTKEPTGARAKVLRQFKAGLDRLEDFHLVELGAQKSKTRYDGFAIMRETGRGDLAEPAYYTVPQSGRMVKVPAEFFTRGWLWALTNSEIATYLMFRHLAQEYPAAHVFDGVYVYGDDREAHYGLRRDAYEAHILLERFEVLHEMASALRGDGNKITGYQAGVRYEALRFKLLDSGLEEDAVLHVLSRLEEP